MLGENEALPSPQVQTRVPKGLDQEDDWQRDSPPPWGQSPYPHLARLLGWWPGIFSNCAEEVTSSPGSARPAGRALQDRQLFLCQDSGAIYQGDKQQPEGRVGGRSCLGEITGGHSEGAKGITSPPWGHPGPAPVPAQTPAPTPADLTRKPGDLGARCSRIPRARSMLLLTGCAPGSASPSPRGKLRPRGVPEGSGTGSPPCPRPHHPAHGAASRGAHCVLAPAGTAPVLSPRPREPGMALSPFSTWRRCPER